MKAFFEQQISHSAVEKKGLSKTIEGDLKNKKAEPKETDPAETTEQKEKRIGNRKAFFEQQIAGQNSMPKKDIK
eukprot:CAMPEP_0177635658 /NCGR_PEP_ID=MMETSP0447-20121125/4024_1 /TAXON_ID=0 /ORGANISM="Stygamoeba regulata, Strain BSH-02190019" /LENGTH=73 /DNA_ID=CAMNT_0019137471 /DNA_START=21 /DNA_END=242 /DNA_ORIENTATION=-